MTFGITIQARKLKINTRQLGNMIEEREVKEAIFELKEVLLYYPIINMVNKDSKDKELIEISKRDCNIITCRKPSLDFCEHDCDEVMKILEKSLNGYLEDGYNKFGVREILILHKLLGESDINLEL